ncbi:hypothetical protein B0T11DRAFT_326358 [Plectosphaerella cucumerina]|uniref:N-acetyltransferase domain-containing protein n=1 Tax=Plectosphaerella cucumerina TaxID=40658 RepID=A0A8K0TKQ0_9PEZI|nr:hypothetical protein B0T11DRAFT_326358 [Plectosphaerella cucumerina]
MTKDDISKDWYRDGYLLSTKPELIQPDAFNAALASDLIWWAKPLPRDQLLKALSNSLCLGLYALPDSTSSIAGRRDPEMVGFCRIITDYVTFGYLTDVYILDGHQGKGLGKWMMDCLNELLEEWPDLRRVLLITGSPDANKLYTKTLGALEWNSSAAGKMSVMQKFGPAVSNR